MIYTTYFAKLKTLPESIIPVAICGKAPDWFHGLQYKILAPRWDFFSEWKKSRDNHYYVEHFQQDVLDRLDVGYVLNDLKQLAGSDEIALVCYEKPEDFCHRHIVANWFRENGIQIKEFGT